MKILITLVLACSCGKAQEPSGGSKEKDIAEQPKLVASDAGEPKAASKNASALSKDAGVPSKDARALEEAEARRGMLRLLRDRDGGAFGSIIGTQHFSSSGGVFVSKVDTPDAEDAKILMALMEKESDSLKPCLNDRRLATMHPSEFEFHLDATGRASSIALPKGQEVPCLTKWIESLELGSPKSGKSVKVKVKLLVARE